MYVSQQRRARGGNFVIGFLNINKYTSASENVHLCLRTVIWVTLVALLVEYLLHSVLLMFIVVIQNQELVDGIIIASSSLKRCSTHTLVGQLSQIEYT